MSEQIDLVSDSPSPCQTCGACCAYSADWPRFWTDTDDAIARIPAAFVADDGCGMGCDGDRCRALQGIVGIATSCTIYDRRPEVCRACEPGDDACSMARERYGLAPINTQAAL
ncbi:MAG: YkgJ family cysteine cluster protein [Hyphomicrobiaceae bacterium]